MLRKYFTTTIPTFLITEIMPLMMEKNGKPDHAEVCYRIAIIIDKSNIKGITVLIRILPLQEKSILIQSVISETEEYIHMNDKPVLKKGLKQYQI